MSECGNEYYKHHKNNKKCNLRIFLFPIALNVFLFFTFFCVQNLILRWNSHFEIRHNLTWYQPIHMLSYFFIELSDWTFTIFIAYRFYSHFPIAITPLIFSSINVISCCLSENASKMLLFFLFTKILLTNYFLFAKKKRRWRISNSIHYNRASARAQMLQ